MRCDESYRPAVRAHCCAAELLARRTLTPDVSEFMFHPGATEFQSGQYALLYLPRAPESPKAIRVPAIHGLAIRGIDRWGNSGRQWLLALSGIPRHGLRTTRRAARATGQRQGGGRAGHASGVLPHRRDGPAFATPAAPALSVGAVIGRLQQRFPEAFPRSPRQSCR